MGILSPHSLPDEAAATRSSSPKLGNFLLPVFKEIFGARSLARAVDGDPDAAADTDPDPAAPAKTCASLPGSGGQDISDHSVRSDDDDDESGSESESVSGPDLGHTSVVSRSGLKQSHARPVLFPPEYLANLDLSSIGSDVLTSSTPSTEDSLSRKSHSPSPVGGYSTSASSPPPLDPETPLGLVSQRRNPVTKVKQRKQSSPTKINLEKPPASSSAPRPARHRGPRSYAAAIAEANEFISQADHPFNPIVDWNYAVVAELVRHGALGHVRGLYGETLPWFSPVPLPPLARVVNVNPRHYILPQTPILTPYAVNPVYMSTRHARLNLLTDKLCFEAKKDAVLHAANPRISLGGVHVFIDMSNIIIGFYNRLKLNRGIPIGQKVQAPPFFFQALSHVLERGRPVSKRVVAGSAVDPDPSNWPSYMKDAELLGYEMNILSRVTKLQSPPRVRHARRATLYNYDNNNTKGNSNSSHGYVMTPSSDEEVMQSSGPTLLKQGEQAVDEILHLKMCESLLDYSPSTMVLATGDAATAEFSSGFLAQAERAFAKGWHVELVTWKSTISSAWQSLAASPKWQNQFRIVPLDWYVEELFDALPPSPSSV